MATSDQPALIRLKGAFVATSIAEFFRDQGCNVLLLMDSLTRFALAQREVGLAIVNLRLPVVLHLQYLLYRPGCWKEPELRKGTITGFYSVLVEGDDMNEPITDAVRGIVDGHIVLSRERAAMNRYPAIDVLQSISRVMPDIISAEHQEAAHRFRSLLATYTDARDLIDIGAYQQGSNPRIDEAISLIDGLESFLQQGVYEPAGFGEVVDELTRWSRQDRSEGS